MGSHETAQRYRKINGRGRELPCLGTRKRKPPARGSGQTHGPAPTREQTETVSQGTHATRLLTELRGAHWNQAETGSCRSMQGLLAASSARNAKDRDAPALEVRTGHRVWGTHPKMLQG